MAAFVDPIVKPAAVGQCLKAGQVCPQADRWAAVVTRHRFAFGEENHFGFLVLRCGNLA